jgi:hypothetical protein
MPQTTDELEAKLMVKAQEAIQKLLAKQKPKEEITLSDMEINVGEFGEELLKEIMQELVEVSSTNENHAANCPNCEKAMRYKGQKSKQMMTLRGEVEIERDYYYSETCRSGYFPPR